MRDAGVYFLLLLFAVAFASTARAYDPEPAKFWWLNTFLDQKTIGRYDVGDNYVGIGPCPSYNNRCEFDLTALPQSVKDIGVTIEGFTGVTLGAVLPQGEIRAYKVEVANVEFEDIVISGARLNANMTQSFAVDVVNFKADVKMHLGLVSIKLPGLTTLPTIDIVVTASKALQTSGTNVSLDLGFDSPAGKTLSTSFPSNSTLRSCSMNVDLALNLDISSIMLPAQQDINNVANLIYGVAEPLLGNFICTAMEQFFITSQGTEGVIQGAVTYAFENLGSLAGRPDPVLAVEEAAMVASARPEDVQASFNFATSNAVKGASVVANGWLGGSGPSGPLINEVVKLLTGPLEGEASFENLASFGLNLTVRTPPFIVGVALSELTLTGLNTFGLNTQGPNEGFQILLNGYDQNLPELRNNYTLDNKLSLRDLGVKARATVSLTNNYGYQTSDWSKDGWLYRERTFGPESTSFELEYELGLKNLNVRAALAVLANAHELSALQVGQLLGKSGSAQTVVGQALDAGKCASPALYGLSLPFLTLEVGEIITPVFNMLDPVDIGIKTLVDTATAQGLSLLEAVVKQDLKLISNHWIRPQVNKLLNQTFLTRTELECPPYYTQGKKTPNLLEGTIFDTAKALINDVLGGDPVNTTNVNINVILDRVVDFGCAAFLSPGACIKNADGDWSFNVDVSLKPGKSFNGNNATSSLTVTGVRLMGLNSIYKLLLDNLVGKPQGFKFDLGLGQAGTNPLVLELTTKWAVDYPIALAPARLDINEEFKLAFSLAGFQISAAINMDYDLDILYQLSLSDLGKSACLFAPLAALELELNMNLSTFSAVVTSISASGNGNKLQQAVAQLIAEQPHANVGAMINFILASVTKFAQSQVEVVTNADGVVTAYNCKDEANSFDNTITRVISHLLSSNFSEQFDKGFGLQPPVPNATVLDNLAVSRFPPFFNPYDFTTSTLLPLISNAIGGITSTQYRNVLADAAAGSGDFVSDSLVEQANGEVGLKLNVLELLPDGFALDFLVEGAKVFLVNLNVSDISRLNFDDMSIIKPIGRFVTETRIRVPGKMSIALDLRIVTPRAFKGLAPGADEVTNLSFSLDLVDLTVDLQTLTALSFSKISAFTLGNFFVVDSNQTFSLNPDMWGCIFGLSFPGGLYLPELKIGVSSFGDIKLAADNDFILSQGTVDLVNSALEIFNDFYAQDLKDITQGALRSLINDFFLVPNLEANRACPAPKRPQLYSTDRILDFERSSTLVWLNEFLSQTLAGGDGKYAVLNSLINGAFNGRTFLDPETTGRAGIQDVNLVYKQNVLGQFRASLGSFKLEDFGTIEELNLLQPTGNTTLYNKIVVGGPFLPEGELSFTLSGLWENNGEDGNYTSRTNNVFLKLEITNLTIAFEVHLEVDLVDLMLVQAGTFSDVTQISCALTALRSFYMLSADLDAGAIGATLKCVSCDSPMLRPLNNGGELTTGDSPVLTELLPGALELFEIYIGSNLFNKQVNDAVGDAEVSCAQSLNMTTLFPVFNAPEPPKYNLAVVLALALSGFGVGIIFLFPLAVPRHCQLKDRMVAEQLQMANAEPGANAQSVARYMAKQERTSIAMASHPAVPMCCKCFVPVMAIINILLLALSFTVYLSFSIDALVIFAGERSKIFMLVPWTISSTVNDFYNSGAAPIALMVVFMSCFWPVVKNMALVIIWYAPRTFLNHALRLRLLIILDLLGKWSFLDVYIIVVLVCGLRFSLVLSRSPYTEFLPIPEQLLYVDCLVTPGVGIIILCIAAFMSLVVNHVIIYLLEDIEFADGRLFKQIDGVEDEMLSDKPLVRIAICDYVFSTSAPNGERDRFRPGTKYGLLGMGGASFVFLIFAMASPFFAFVYSGLIGYALLFFLEGGRERPFQLFGMVSLLANAGDGTAYYDAVFLFFNILYLATVILAPLLQLVLQCIVWAYPMSLRNAKLFLFWSKVVSYWASIEVFVVAIVATSIEIAPVAAFLVDSISGGGCTALKVPLAQVLDVEQAYCLFSAVRMDWGLYVIILATLCQIGAGAVFIRAVGVAIRDREDVLEGRPHREWTPWEYRVLNVLLINGAEHHKPKPGKPLKCVKCALDCKENPFGNISLGSFCSCCKGVEDVGVTTTTAGKKVANASKWNTAAPTQSSNQWNNNSFASPVQSGNQWNNSANFSQVGGGNNTNSMQWNNSQVVSSNPVYSMESRKPQYSVDV